MTISSGILRIFFQYGRKLIPISFDEPHRLKRPLHTDWTTREYPTEKIEEYAAHGYNLGWRLDPGDLVIDLDPRNDEDGGIARFVQDFRDHHPEVEDLGDFFPAVKSGRGDGGTHLYAKIPPGVKVKNSIQKYGKGVEFKTVGRQVIIPGSIHPVTGDPYEFDDFSIYDEPSTPLPQWLFDAIAREEPTTATKPADGSAELSPTQLASLLSQLPATEYSTNEDWFPLMAAAHEATGGAGLEAFIAWSLSDSSFAGHDHIIRYRWESFQPGRAGNIGAGTLYKEVVRHGGQLPSFGVDKLKMFGIDQDLPPAPERALTPAPVVIRYADKVALDKDVEKLHPVSPSDEIRSVLSQVALVDSLDQERYIQAIHKQTGRQAGTLRKALSAEKTKRLTEEPTSLDDVALEITTHLIQKKFEGGRYLVHAEDQRFWQFIGTHWQPVEPNIIDNLLLKASYQYRQANPQINTGISTLIGQAERILRARRAVGQNLHQTLDGRPPVVNTKNCEVWIDPDTGMISPKRHRPESWLTSCLPVDFDPKARCPIFSRALQEMFEPCADRDDVIRHLWEIMGYIIQPQKDLAAWVLFRGEGANGKTVVLNVLEALLGDASLNKSIEDLDTRRYNHAFADLPGKLCVIDEDLDAQITLPDSILKKISESKMLTANPKMFPTFKFRNTAIPVFASNPWPRIKDLSNGMRRRAHVFEFRRKFEESEQDRTLGQRIIENELSGVLIEALRGFRRLRQRGTWKTPESCDKARRQWLTRSNTIGEFLEEAISEKPGKTAEFAHLYGAYKMWCLDNGYNHQNTKPGFRKSLESLGYNINHGVGNKVVVRDIEINETTIHI